MTKKELLQNEELNGNEIIIIREDDFTGSFEYEEEAENELFDMFIQFKEIEDDIVCYLNKENIIYDMKLDYSIIDLNDYEDDEELA